MKVFKYRNGFEVTLHPDVLEQPLNWKKPQVIFVNSMSDLFHPKVPFSFVRDMFGVMGFAGWHVFQILTKRPKRLVRFAQTLDPTASGGAPLQTIGWPENVWMGVTVESEKYLHRIDNLREVNAPIRFLSMEPLLGPVPNLNLKGIDWVIVGGESGPGARPMNEEWVLDIKRQCEKQDAAFFFKQWGGVNKKKTGRLLLGRTWDDSPSLPCDPEVIEPAQGILNLL